MSCGCNGAMGAYGYPSVDTSGYGAVNLLNVSRETHAMIRQGVCGTGVKGWWRCAGTTTKVGVGVGAAVAVGAAAYLVFG